jgi:hypothetical protein
MEALKATLPGSLLKLTSGKWHYVPVSSTESCIIGGSNRASKLRTIEVLGGANKDKTPSDLTSSVKEIFIGVLMMSEGPGSAAASLSVLGMPATIALVDDPAGGNAITHAQLKIQGMTQPVTTLDQALGQLGLLPKPWAGGARPAPLRGNPDHPSLGEARAVDMPLIEIMGGGAMASLLVAKLRILTLQPAIADIAAVVAADLVAGLAGLGDRVDALTVSLGAGPLLRGVLTSGTAATVDQCATIATRAALLAAVGATFEALPQPVLASAASKITQLTNAGHSVTPSGIGPIVITILDQLDAMPAAVPPTPAKPTAPKQVSPRDALIAEQAAQIRAFLGGQPPPESSAPEPAPPPQLLGMEFLRPEATPPAAPLTDLQLLAAMGGERVACKIATLAGSVDPIVILSGAGSGSFAIELAADFAIILQRARAFCPLEQRFSDILSASSRPLDEEEAGSRLRTVFRVLQQQPDPAMAPTADANLVSAPAAAPRARSAGDDNITVVSESAPAIRVSRACNAAVLNRLVTDEEFRKSAAHAALEDPVAEARRNIELHGVPAQLYLGSSGESNARLTGPLPPRIVAARTGWVAYTQLRLEQAATISRVKAVATETLALRSDIVALDMTWKPIQLRYGGLRPTPGEWRSNRLVAKPSAGRWGLMDGPLAYADCERAAVGFAPLLITAIHEIAGGPAPVEPTLGLVPLVQATVGLTDVARTILLDEAFERISQAHHARCSDPSLPPADPEAIFLDCRMRAVAPIESTADAEASGAAAGIKAATALLQSAGLLGKRPEPAPTGTPPVEEQRSKAQKRKDRKTAADLLKGSLALPLQPAALAAAPAATGLAALAVAAKPTPSGGGKPLPLAAGEPAPGSISEKAGLLDKKGGGLVEVLDRMHFALDTSQRIDLLPCGWMAALAKCDAHAAGKCPKCKNGTAPDASVLSRGKAACCPALLAKLPVGSAVATAL